MEGRSRLTAAGQVLQPNDAAAGTYHSSSFEATDHCIVCSGHSAAMGRTRCRATCFRQGDQLFATRFGHTGARSEEFTEWQRLSAFVVYSYLSNVKVQLPLNRKMSYKIKTTGPFILIKVDNNHPRYLHLSFSDGFTRKMAKGGNWPPEYAEACLAKAQGLLNKSVFIKTSQTTAPWKTTEWLCDIQAEEIVAVTRALARKIEPEKTVDVNDSIEKYILASCTTGKTFFANAAPVSAYFDNDDDLLDFSQSFEKGFVSAWTAKNARNAKLPAGIKRVRISGLGERTKRNGFRVVAAEIQTEDTSEAFRFFHLLRIDEKAEKEDYLSDSEVKEIIEMRKALESRYPKGVVSWIDR